MTPPLNELSEILRHYWTILVSLFAALSWLVRLETRVTGNTNRIQAEISRIDNDVLREINRIEQVIARDREEARTSRSETNEMLKEVRNDLRHLITKHMITGST